VRALFAAQTSSAPCSNGSPIAPLGPLAPYAVQVEGTRPPGPICKQLPHVRIGSCRGSATLPAKAALLARSAVLIGSPRPAPPSVPTGWLELELRGRPQPPGPALTAAVGLPTLRLIRNRH